MGKPLTEDMKKEIKRVMEEKCDTSNFGIRDAFTFAGCIPNINQQVTDKSKKYTDQPKNVLDVFERCRKAEKAIENDRDPFKLGPRKGQGIKHPITHAEILVKESMEKTAAVVQSDKAGVCHTLAQFAFVNLMRECQLSGRSYDDWHHSNLPSIRIVAHNPASDDPSKKLRSATTHNFVIVGFDSTEELNYENLEKMKDQILIVDPWYFALGNKSESGFGVYTMDEYPAGFLKNLSCTYDNQKPYTQQTLEADRAYIQKMSLVTSNVDNEKEIQRQKQITALQKEINALNVTLSHVEIELSSDEDDWEIEEKSNDKEIKEPEQNLEQKAEDLKKEISTKKMQLEKLEQENQESSPSLKA